jgi:DNA-directed RNA polymerase subunit RPC12/RpoP
MELKEMCRIMYPYTCPACGNHMLFFTRNRNNSIIDYKELIESIKDNDKIKEFLAERDVEYLKCVICKKIFIIDWTKEYAKPLIYRDALKHFGYKFKE